MHPNACPSKTYFPKSPAEKYGYVITRAHETLNIPEKIQINLKDCFGCIQPLFFSAKELLDIIKIIEKNTAIRVWSIIFDMSWTDSEESVAYIKDED